MKTTCRSKCIFLAIGLLALLSFYGNVFSQDAGNPTEPGLIQANRHVYLPLITIDAVVGTDASAPHPTRHQTLLFGPVKVANITGKSTCTIPVFASSHGLLRVATERNGPDYNRTCYCTSTEQKKGKLPTWNLKAPTRW